MKIAVVDLVCVQGGGYNILKSLYSYVSSGTAKEHEWLFIVSEQAFKENKYIKVIKFPKAKKNYIQRIKTEYYNVNKTLDEFSPDIILSMPNIRVFGCNRKQVVYLQQSLPFQKKKTFSFLKEEERDCAFRQYIQGMIIRNSCRKAKAVFVQTEWIKYAVQECIRNKPIINIGYPINQEENPSPRANKLNAEFFYPASHYIYKNHKTLFEAIAILKKRKYKPKVYLTLNPDDLKVGTLEGSVIYIGQQSKDQMQKLYTETTLVFPSYIETVGLPLVEARAAGTWIIASDCPFSHEVLDGYSNCEYFDPFNAVQLADRMERVLNGQVKWKTVYHTDKSTESCWDKMVHYLEKM